MGNRQGNIYADLSNKIRHIYDIHMMLKNEEIRNFFESKLFDEMINNVGQDDVISYQNKNEWLKEYPVKAIIFDQIDQTLDDIRTSYLTNFKKLVMGEFPNEEELIATLNNVKNRLQSVDWIIKVD